MRALFTFLLLTSLCFAQDAKMKHTSPLNAKQLEKKISKLTSVTLNADLKSLSKEDKEALEKIIQAARLMDEVYIRQVWSGNVKLREELAKDNSSLGGLLYHLFRQNAGPWSRMDEDEIFVTGVPKKPLNAGVYPDDMTKEEFQTWFSGLTEKEKAAASGFFHVIKRTADKKLTAVPYSEEYKEFLAPAAALLKEAAQLTKNETLKKYLTTRADAFSSNEYYLSDVAWMDLDAPIDLTIGPYETYEDGLFNYKAMFEAFVTIRDDAESAKLAKFSQELQGIENNLPLPDLHKNPKLGALSPIRVVDQVFASGEARRGVMTAAFNLPNDEKVIKEKGSKRVMLKNVQEAKFKKVLIPISKVVLPAKEQSKVDFDAFFTHILMHELCHGLGPHNIKVDGKETTVRMQLKELYSAIEEAKADITGLFALQLLVDKGVNDKKMEATMYTTFLASSFRSIRFGINEAHGKGVALQLNYLVDEGGYSIDAKKNLFTVNPDKIKEAVKKLTGVILLIQAEGSYEKAKALLDKYGVVRPETQAVFTKLSTVPVDIEPYYTLAK